MARDDGPCPVCGMRSPAYECPEGHISCRHCAHGSLEGEADWDREPTCPECGFPAFLRP